jgi:hypothetical protein
LGKTKNERFAKYIISNETKIKKLYEMNKKNIR